MIVCKTHKKPPPRPVVGLLTAATFNHTVALDLHSLDKKFWYFHIIDEFTRFSNVRITKSKSPTIIIKNFLQNWINIFGSPSKVFSDNGREFVSEEFSNFCKNVNIKISTSPAESPKCNGKCKRHNAILTEILLWVKDNINSQWDTVLFWALNARNYFINVSGFSLHQLVFGKNVNLPSAMNDQLSAGYSTNPLIIEHLKALHSVRESFMKAELATKLRNV